MSFEEWIAFFEVMVALFAVFVASIEFLEMLLEFLVVALEGFVTLLELAANVVVFVYIATLGRKSEGREGRHPRKTRFYQGSVVLELLLDGWGKWPKAISPARTAPV